MLRSVRSTASPYDPAYAQSKVSKRRRGKEIQDLLNSSLTKAEDNWISWNNPPPRDRFNVTLHANTDAYRVYDWVAERTSMLQVDFAVSAKKVADDYLTQRRIDFCTGTLNSEKTFQSARNRILWSLHQPRYYWYLGMPSVPGYQWDVERGDTRDQLVIIDKRKLEDLPEGERTYRIAYSTLINQGFDEVMWAHGCILEYTRILMGAMIGTPYPSESRYKDVNKSVDSRSAARWFIAQSTAAYWRVTDRYLNASYQLSRTDATNPGFRISSWVANEISTCYYQRCDMMSEYANDLRRESQEATEDEAILNDRSSTLPPISRGQRSEDRESTASFSIQGEGSSASAASHLIFVEHDPRAEKSHRELRTRAKRGTDKGRGSSGAAGDSC